MMKLLRILIITVLFNTTFFINNHKAFCDKTYSRIVSMSPSITEMIEGLDATDKIIGVTIYDNTDKPGSNIASVGGWVNPNLEVITALEPDLIVLMKPQDKMFGDKLRRLNLDIHIVDANESISSIKKAITALGVKLNKEKQAANLVKKINTEIDQIQAKTRTVEPKTVLFVVGRNPGTLNDIYIIGKTGFINEIIDTAGGKNATDSSRFSLKISIEGLLSYDPDVIVEVNHSKANISENNINEWKEFKESSAVKQNQVYTVSSTSFLHPSQRVVEAIGILARILHPELFSDNARNN